MLKIFSLSLFFFSLLACKQQAVIEDSGEVSEKTKQIELDGNRLYTQNCVYCHGALNVSDIIDYSANQINYAILDNSEMNDLENLTHEQLIEIESVLSSDHPSRVLPKIISAAPNGKYPGATSTLVLEVTTDIASTCYFSSLDVTVDKMSDELNANSNNLIHQKTLSLSVGAQYKYYVHCKDLKNENITKVSQLITFSTDLDAVDTTAPNITNLFSETPLLGGTTKTNIWVNTNESATCRYSTNSSHTYNQMSEMDITGTLGHITTVTGLSNGNSFSYYILCRDSAGNTSNKDMINFSILSSVDGNTLFNRNCKSCHGSSIRNYSTLEIENAIKNVNRMKTQPLEFLSPEQLEAISY